MKLSQLRLTTVRLRRLAPDLGVSESALDVEEADEEGVCSKPGGGRAKLTSPGGGMAKFGGGGIHGAPTGLGMLLEVGERG